MKRVDRRTFLVNSMRTGAIVAATGSVGYYEWELFQPASSAAARQPGPPVALKVNGEPSPVGVDPDDVSFAWQVADPRRGAIQSAYRLVVSPAGGGAKVWDSAEVISGRQAFVAYEGPPCNPTPHTCSVSRPATHTASGAGHLEPRTVRDRAPPRGLEGAMAPSRPGRHGPRAVHIRANGLRARCRGDRARRRLRRCRPQVPALDQRPAGRHRTELVLPRRAVRAGDRREQGTLTRGAERDRIPPSLVQRGQGKAAIRAGTAGSALCALHRWKTVRRRHRWHVEAAPSRVAARSTAEYRRR